MTETQWTGMAATPIVPTPVAVTAFRRGRRSVTTGMVKMVMGAPNLALTNFAVTA